MYATSKPSYMDEIRGSSYVAPNSFKDLFPNYRPSISTEETHGKYRPIHFDNTIRHTVNNNLNTNSDVKMTFSNATIPSTDTSNMQYTNTMQSEQQRQFITPNTNCGLYPPQNHPNNNHLNYVPNTTVHQTQQLQAHHPSPPQQTTTHHSNMHTSSQPVHHPTTYQPQPQKTTLSPQQTTIQPQPVHHMASSNIVNPNTKYIAIHTPTGKFLVTIVTDCYFWRGFRPLPFVLKID